MSWGAALLGAGALAVIVIQGCRPRTPEAGPHSALVVLVPALPDVLDPFRDSAGAGDVVFVNVFEPLVRFTPSGAVEPALAGSWDASRPGELTLELRPGVRFHDGTPLEAAQAVASLEAARKPGSPFAALLADVSEVRASGRGGVLVKAVAGATLTPQALADIPIVKPALGGALPSGTGPYRVTAFTTGENATLEAVEGHATRPTLAQITIRRFHTSDDLLRSLAGGEPPLVLAPSADALAFSGSNERYRVVTQPGNDVIVLACDVGREPTPGVGLSKNPFRSPAVRRAMRLALDRDALGKDLEGGGVAATQIVPPASFGFDPSLEPPSARADQARALLREAGLPKGFEVRLDLAREHEALGHAVAVQLEAVGIRVKLNPLAGNRLGGVMENESSLALWSWRPGSDAPSALRVEVHTRTPERGFGSRNWTGYSDAEVDKGIEKALATAEPVARREALRASLRRLAEDSAWVPLLVPNASFVLPKGLTFPARLDGRVTLAEARLEPQPTPTPPAKRRQASEKRAMTGAWSEGCFPFRSLRSIPASTHRRASGSLTRI